MSKRPRVGLFAAWESEVAGGKRIAELAFGQDNPQQNVDDAIKKARYWFQYNWMVGTIVLLRIAFYNFGLKVKAVDKNEQPEVEKWLKKKNPLTKVSMGEEVKRYARDAWQEFLVTDNVVGLWRITGRPLVFQAEECEFIDKFGVEKLIITLNMTQKELEGLGLSPAELNQVKGNGGKLSLLHNNPVFFFDVVKREKIGSGFAWPGLARCFLGLAQNEGMEVGDNLMGQTDRKVYEQHIMGHETRYGPYAGTKLNFVNQDRANKMQQQLKGKVGHIVMGTNFDHKIIIGAGRVDPKFYDAKKYEAIIKRLGIWGAPLAQMFLERNLNPNLMDLLKQLAIADREYLAPHLCKVYRDSLKAPVDVNVTWSNRCFSDARLAADLLKFGIQWGYLSQQSAQEQSGYESDVEYERKAEEAKKPEAETQPLVDANHGKDKDRAGRKRGTADGGKTD